MLQLSLGVFNRVISAPPADGICPAGSLGSQRYYRRGQSGGVAASVKVLVTATVGRFYRQISLLRQ